MKTNPKKEEVFERSLVIIRIIKENQGISGQRIADKLGVSKKMANYYCSRLKRAGLLKTKRGLGGGHFLKTPVKIGQLMAAMDMPMLETGFIKADAKFREYLNTEIEV